eukprot:TRINITY_DN1961_c0_g1_i2.p1 TRINITY_DN1961_c0_g1~~TRINITY_DN1961_c0_g1_i2.p1  ORF type:complete len:193 (-),score=53.55 TRINITY_DN1961_c0_g1_i2:265-843(-)
MPSLVGSEMCIRDRYKADDEDTHFKRRQKAKKVAIKLRKSITPGTVLILLTGRFRGKRVVFLKQLKSGLLLVTGPYKINGVPLKRVNQAYVIPTGTKVPIANADFSKIEDAYFARTRLPKAKKSADNFFKNDPKKIAQLKEVDKEKIAKKKLQQKEVDAKIIENAKKIPFLGKYLSSKFTIGNTVRPHELVF